MSYTKNPHLPLVRMQAVSLVRAGWSARKAARYLGFHHTAILKWLKKATEESEVIPTESSRPHSHPRKLSKKIVNAIVKERKKHRRCAEVVHQTLLNRHIEVSLSSVKRTLKRQYLLRERNKYKRWHYSIPRPHADAPGDLVQIDTIHIVPLQGERVYIYTLIDLCSRWTYAKATPRINTHQSLKFVREAQGSAPFKFKMIQLDHVLNFQHGSRSIYKNSISAIVTAGYGNQMTMVTLKDLIERCKRNHSAENQRTSHRSEMPFNRICHTTTPKDFTLVFISKPLCRW